MILRCPACRTRRATWQGMLSHVSTTGHTWCYCSGGGKELAWSARVGKHRPGTPGCVHRPDDLQQAADAAWDGAGVKGDAECPF